MKDLAGGYLFVAETKRMELSVTIVTLTDDARGKINGHVFNRAMWVRTTARMLASDITIPLPNE